MPQAMDHPTLNWRTCHLLLKTVLCPMTLTLPIFFWVKLLLFLRCFTIGLCNGHLDTVYCSFMLSEETRYRSVTHIKSDFIVPDCCGLPEFCNKVLCLWNIQIVLGFCPLGDCGVIVYLYLWVCVVVFSLVIVLFRSHMAALQHSTQSSISVPLLLCLAVALLHNVQLWSGVVWWKTSAPLLLQNPLITWFCLCLAFFHIPAMWKKVHKHTNSIQMTTEEIQLQETYSPPALPWAHRGLCCMRTRMGGWACCILCTINN